MGKNAALRRYQAVHWLECVVGPLGVNSEPTEREFLSLLRNGIILCNVINLIQPGTIPKVVENHVAVESEAVIWDARPLPAYQYFENVRNFLMAVEELKLPGFEASDLEREGFEARSAARVADCILALRAYYEWKDWSGGNGVYKHVTNKSPLVLHSASKNISRPVNKTAPQPCTQLDLAAVDDKQSLTDSIVQALVGHMVDSKENMNINFLTSYENENQDAVQMFIQILSSCLEEKLRNRQSAVKLQETSAKSSGTHALTTLVLKENHSSKSKSKYHRAQSRKGSDEHWMILQSQERDLSDIKGLWAEAKRDFEDLQCQLMNNLSQLGRLAEELSTPALGYQKVVQENRKLYNMIQDLKGNVRVYCKIRPMLNANTNNVIALGGEDGSLVIIDPSKSRTDRRKLFQFNSVFGSMAAQDEIFKDAQPMIRSVMDGYNVCIFAYGQTGSGKTHTMYGPTGVLEKETGINFLALNDLFEIVNERKDTMTYELHIQMVEICREETRDLLSEESAFQDGSSLPKLTSRIVKTNTDAVNLVKQGQMKCADVTSREIAEPRGPSHSVLTIQAQGRDLSGNVLRGRLHLVDLAGSGEDDKSLASLEDVMTSLSQKNSSIHYRNSRLTSLLQDALGRHAKILVFAHVISEEDSFSKTMDTLNFVQSISTIELGAAQSNIKNHEVMELKREIEMLKSGLGGKSPYDKPRVMLQRTPPKARRLSMGNPGSVKPDKIPKSHEERQKLRAETSPCPIRTSIKNPSSRSDPKSPHKAKDVGVDRHKEQRSPCDKPRVMLQRTPPKARRLSMENPGSMKADKIPKSPKERQKLRVETTPPRSLRMSVENPNARRDQKSPYKYKEPRSPGEKPTVVGSTAGPRRLSIENPTIIRNERAQRMNEPKSPQEGKKGSTKRTPPLSSRRLSIENPSSVNHGSENRKVIKTAEISPRIRRLSLEGPEDRMKVCLNSAGVTTISNACTGMVEIPKSPTLNHLDGPTFTDCATISPALEPQKTPDQRQNCNQHEMPALIYPGYDTLNDTQTPGIAKSTNGKGSQIKKSLRTIGKLIRGSEKRNQHKLESSSIKGKYVANEAPKSPPTTKAKDSRRQSLTGFPPPGSNRRSSLGDMSTLARPNVNRNAKTPPPVRSSTTKITKRWM